MSEVVLSREENVQPIAIAPQNPIQLLQTALENGGDPNLMIKLLEAQAIYEASNAKKAFDRDLTNARSKFPPIKKTNKAGGKNGSYGYTYESLTDINSAVKDILKEHGLAYRFRTESKNGEVTVTCILSHYEGHAEESSLTSPIDTSGGKNSIQGLGSALTYLERYTLKAALGIAATDKDDDAQSVGQSLITDQQFKQLQSLVDETKADIAGLCYTYGVDAISHLPANMFLAVKNVLEGRKAKQQQKAKETANADHH